MLQLNVYLLSALEQFDLFNILGHQVGGFSNILFFFTMLFFVAYIAVNFDTRGVRNPITFFVCFFVFDFLRQLLSENVHSQRSIYFYYTVALFTFIVWCNILGLVPYTLTVTSYLAVTLFLSGMSFFGNLVIGLRTHSWSFFRFFVPAGAPVAILWLLVAIEFVSYASRLFSLAIRLFANMMAGHALLKILSGFVFLALQSGPAFLAFAAVLNLVVIAVTVLEVLIAVLQAYVFVVLSTIYTNEAINLH